MQEVCGTSNLAKSGERNAADIGAAGWGWGQTCWPASVLGWD